jgi:hypothetical protein
MYSVYPRNSFDRSGSSSSIRHTRIWTTRPHRSDRRATRRFKRHQTDLVADVPGLAGRITTWIPSVASADSYETKGAPRNKSVELNYTSVTLAVVAQRGEPAQVGQALHREPRQQGDRRSARNTFALGVSLLVSLDQPERHTDGSTREPTRACLEFPRFRGHVRVSQAWWIRTDTGLSKPFLVTLWAAVSANAVEGRGRSCARGCLRGIACACLSATRRMCCPPEIARACPSAISQPQLWTGRFSVACIRMWRL